MKTIGTIMLVITAIGALIDIIILAFIQVNHTIISKSFLDTIISGFSCASVLVLFLSVYILIDKIKTN